MSEKPHNIPTLLAMYGDGSLKPKDILLARAWLPRLVRNNLDYPEDDRRILRNMGLLPIDHISGTE